MFKKKNLEKKTDLNKDIDQISVNRISDQAKEPRNTHFSKLAKEEMTHNRKEKDD